MTRARLFAAVIAVAVGASALTSSGVASADPGGAVDVAPAAGTPLAVRPSKPLELADDAPRLGVAWKLGAIVVVGALAAWVWRQRSPVLQAQDLPSLRILRRTSIGVRSELLVIEMDGQRLLLGVTPTTIQNLYIAPLAEDERLATDEVEAVVEPRAHATEPVRRARDPEPVRRARDPEPVLARSTRKQVVEAVEEQARGITAIAERK